MYKRLEHNIQEQVMQYLRFNGFKVWRCNVGSRVFVNPGSGVRRFVSFGERGMPDVMAIKPGKPLICLEIKSRTGKTTIFQDRWLQDARDHGAIAGVVRNVEEVEKLINP